MFLAVPEPSPTPPSLLSEDPSYQNLMALLALIAALLVVVSAAVGFIRWVLPLIRKMWTDRLKLVWGFDGVAHYGNVISPRSRTFPTVDVHVLNDSPLELPGARMSYSTVSGSPGTGSALKADRTLSVRVPLTEARTRGIYGSEVEATRENWELAKEITVTLTWDVGRKKTKSRSWSFRVADVPGLRATHP